LGQQLPGAAAVLLCVLYESHVGPSLSLEEHGTLSVAGAPTKPPPAASITSTQFHSSLQPGLPREQQQLLRKARTLINNLVRLEGGSVSGGEWGGEMFQRSIG
jgi:hypothetical protein